MERIEKLQQYLEKEPTDSFLRHALGLEYMKLGKDDAARVEFETLLANDPSYVGTYYQLARLLEKLGQTDAAIDMYNKGIVVAQAAGDNHARNELQMALDDLE